ncbi:MAG: hypothetical protein ACP5EQ_07110 [Candidatus Cloacimonadia bacterium]
MKNFGFTEKDLDERSIDRHNKHFWLLPKDQQNEVQHEFIMKNMKENLIGEINKFEIESDSQKEQIAHEMYGKDFEDCTYKELKKMIKKSLDGLKTSCRQILKWNLSGIFEGMIINLFFFRPFLSLYYINPS